MVNSDEVLVVLQEPATVVMGLEWVLGTPPEPATVARVDSELSVGLTLVAEVFGGAWQREFIWSTTWRIIPRMFSCVRKAVNVGGWLGHSVVAEGVSPVRIELLFCEESLGLVVLHCFLPVACKEDWCYVEASTHFEHCRGVTQKCRDSSNSKQATPQQSDQ